MTLNYLTAVSSTITGKGKGLGAAKKTKVCILRPNQKESYGKVVKNRLCIIHGPTGSGKTLNLIAPSLHHAKKGRKVLLSSPQNAILRGFNKNIYVEIDGESTYWSTSKAAVQELYEFLTNPPMLCTYSGRIRTCTHAALVAVYKRICEDLKSGALTRNPFDDLFLGLDEIHHSGFGLADDDEIPYDTTEEERIVTNGLGEIVKHFCTTKSRNARLAVATATWVRSSNSIIPKEHESKFTRHVYETIDYIKDTWGSKGLHIEFKIALDEPLEALKIIISKDPTQKTIVFLPRGNSAEHKLRLLAKVKAVLNRLGVSYVDLVNPEKRDDRLKELGQQIESNTEPSVILALGMCREGFDWPHASRVIMMKPSNSMGDTLQVFGRLMRYVPGKHSVTMYIILSTGARQVVKNDDVCNYISKIFEFMTLATQFEWSSEQRPSPTMVKQALTEILNFSYSKGQAPTLQDIRAILENFDKKVRQDVLDLFCKGLPKLVDVEFTSLGEPGTTDYESGYNLLVSTAMDLLTEKITGKKHSFHVWAKKAGMISESNAIHSYIVKHPGSNQSTLQKIFPNVHVRELLDRMVGKEHILRQGKGKQTIYVSTGKPGPLVLSSSKADWPYIKESLLPKYKDQKNSQFTSTQLGTDLGKHPQSTINSLVKNRRIVKIGPGLYRVLTIINRPNKWVDAVIHSDSDCDWMGLVISE